MATGLASASYLDGVAVSSSGTRAVVLRGSTLRVEHLRMTGEGPHAGIGTSPTSFGTL